jgi:Dolichyl-phosphate-mannose-protein mannosyltransferase
LGELIWLLSQSGALVDAALREVLMWNHQGTPMPSSQILQMRRHSLLIALLLIFITDYLVNLLGIEFPIYWHDGELSKARQLETGLYNFYHPQLMLRITSVFNSIFPFEESTRGIVLSGRFASAAAAATATAAFAAIVMRRFGLAFGIVTAIAIGMTPNVFFNAHYFKEDASLLMGIALSLLALQSVELNAGRDKHILLGLAIGIACSAKYIGIIMFLPAIAMIISKRTGWANAGCMVGASICVFVGVNAAGIFGTSSIANGLLIELNHVTSNHQGLRFGASTPRSLGFFWQNTVFAFLLLWLLGLGHLMFRSLRLRRLQSIINFEGVIYFMPIVILMVLQLSVTAAPRYSLPATAIVVVAAVWTSATYFVSARTRFYRAAPLSLISLGLAVTFWSFVQSVDIVEHPPATELVNWISSNLPRDAKIAADQFSNLPTTDLIAIDPSPPIPPQSIELLQNRAASELSIARLRAEGFSFVVLAKANYSRFFDPYAHVISDDARARKKFYEEVLATLRPIHSEGFEADAGHFFGSRRTVYDLQSQK